MGSAHRLMPSFMISHGDALLVQQIVARAMTSVLNAPPFMEEDLEFDLTACHANGCPLQLVKLLGASEDQFWNDLDIIVKGLNRSTGILEGYALPKFAVRH